MPAQINREIQPLWKSKLGKTIAFSPDSKSLAVGGARGPVRLLEVVNGTTRLVCEGPKADIYSIAFSPDGKVVAIAPFNRRVSICDSSSGKLLNDIRVDNKEVENLAFSSKNGQLLRTSWKKKIEIIELKSATICGTIKPDTDVFRILQTSFFPAGDKLFVVWKNNTTAQEVAIGNLLVAGR